MEGKSWHGGVPDIYLILLADHTCDLLGETFTASDRGELA